MCYVVDVLLVEVNVVLDNLLIFLDIGEVLLGGNFYVEFVVFVVDNFVFVVLEIGVLVECCIVLLIDVMLLGLFLFFVKDGGVNFGFMIVYVMVVVFVLENKMFVYLVLVDLLLILVN